MSKKTNPGERPQGYLTGRTIIGIVALIVVLILAGLITYVYVKTAKEGGKSEVVEVPSNTPQTNTTPMATMAKYNQLQNGMSKQQVFDIMGGPGELIVSTGVEGRPGFVQHWTWDGDVSGAYCKVRLTDGSVDDLTQSGLP